MQMHRLMQRMDQLETINSSHPSPFDTPISQSHPQPAPFIKAYPEKFCGNTARFRDFKIAIENIFLLDPFRLPTEEIKVRFIGTLLADEALSWFRTPEAKPHILSSYPLLISEFQALTFAMTPKLGNMQ